MFELDVIEGDLLKARELVIAHQCNCVSTNAAGVALQLFQKYPWANVYEDEHVNAMGRYLGRYTASVGHGKIILALYAQFYPGKPRESDSSESRLYYFRESLLKFLVEVGVPEGGIAMPYGIGCGLAGGHWPHYEQTLKEISQKFKVRFALYRL